ncbi:flagellin [Peribacillus asahii]|uniref:flagellin N-terminal helical domain-containing protein n=1 Tax=Peribacillus asahii TaxID=228899 RepID=UPI003810C781
MKINHNISALNAYRNLAVNNNNVSKNLEKLSSGLRINRAADDAAGLAISEKMRSQIRGLDMAERNALDAISFIQTAEGALSSTHEILQRMRELAVQAANGTNTETDRASIQEEINQLTNEINRIGNTTEFNTKKLLNGNLEIHGNGRMIKGGSITGVEDGAITLDSTSILPVGNYQVEVVNTNLTQSVLNDTKSTLGSAGAINLPAADYKAVVTTEAVLDSSSIVIGTASSTSQDVFDGVNPLSVAADSKLDGDFKVRVEKDSAGDVTIILLDVNDVALSNPGRISNADISGGTAPLTNLNFGQGIIINLDPNGLKDMGTPETVDLEFRVDQKKIVEIKDNTGNPLATPIREVIDTTSGANSIAIGSTGLVLNYNQSTISNGELAFTVHNPAAKVLVVKHDADNDGMFETEMASKAFTAVDEIVDFIDYGIKIQAITDTSGKLATFTIEKEDKSAIMQIGANAGQTVSLEIKDMQAAALGISRTDKGGEQTIKLANGEDLTVWYTETKQSNNGTTNEPTEYSLDISTNETAQAAISVLDDAIQRVSAERSRMGAMQNRLEHTSNNLKYMSENTTAAESRIRDLDMALEMTAYTKNNILIQSAQAMLAQANQLPQGVLQLLK